MPCTDGTWTQLDFVESGPQILNFEVREGRKSIAIHTSISNDNQNLEGHEAEIKEMFAPFFSQSADKSGMNRESFYLMKSAFECWNHYEELTERLIRIGSKDDTQWDKEPLLCNTVKNPMKAVVEEEIPVYY